MRYETGTRPLTPQLRQFKDCQTDLGDDKLHSPMQNPSTCRKVPELQFKLLE